MHGPARLSWSLCARAHDQRVFVFKSLRDGGQPHRLPRRSARSHRPGRKDCDATRFIRHRLRGRWRALRAIQDGQPWVDRARESYRLAGAAAAAELGLPAPQGSTFLFVNASGCARRARHRGHARGLSRRRRGGRSRERPAAEITRPGCGFVTRVRRLKKLEWRSRNSRSASRLAEESREGQGASGCARSDLERFGEFGEDDLFFTRDSCFRDRENRRSPRRRCARDRGSGCFRDSRSLSPNSAHRVRR